MSVSVVIPTFNGAKFVGAALESVFAQSTLPREIVVVDDCSTDNTLHVVGTVANASPIPVIVERLSTNSGGPSRPINEGVRAASGELVTVLDQDDVFRPSKIERDVSAFEACPDASIAFQWHGVVGEDGRTGDGDEARDALRRRADAHGPHLVFSGRVGVELLVRHNNFFGGYPAFTFPRRAWERVGGVDETLKIAGDLDFIGRLLSAGSGVLTDAIGYDRRWHDSNASKRSLLLELEGAAVRAGMLAELPELREDAAFVEGFRGELLGIAHGCGVAGRYDQAWRLGRAARDMGEPRHRIWSLAAKLAVKRLLDRFVRSRHARARTDALRDVKPNERFARRRMFDMVPGGSGS